MKNRNGGTGNSDHKNKHNKVPRYSRRRHREGVRRNKKALSAGSHQHQNLNLKEKVNINKERSTVRQSSKAPRNIAKEMRRIDRNE